MIGCKNIAANAGSDLGHNDKAISVLGYFHICIKKFIENKIHFLGCINDMH